MKEQSPESLLNKKFIMLFTIGVIAFIGMNLIKQEVMMCTPTDEQYAESEWSKTNMTLTKYTEVCEQSKNSVFYTSFLFLIVPILFYLTIKRMFGTWNKKLKICLESQGYRCTRCSSSIGMDDAWYGQEEKKAWCNNCAIILGFDKELEK